jgi:hypothetical protein
MAITIVTTPGGATSNSYVTLVEANEYFEGVNWFDSTWAGLTEAVRNSYLVLSTRAIDRLNFQGGVYDTGQALQFPRDFTNEQTDYGAIPQVVKDAQCEAIIWLYNRNTDGEPSIDLKSLKVGRGALDVVFDEQKQPDYSMAGGYPSAVKALLRYFLISANNVVLLRG